MTRNRHRPLLDTPPTAYDARSLDTSDGGAVPVNFNTGLAWPMWNKGLERVMGIEPT